MVKVNVVSGFLGAGKTTLIKHLATALTENNEKVVILVNEFGRVGIDGKMLELEGLSVCEITSGCICCTLKNDFMSTLIKIADDILPDRILIEPSGIFVLSEMHDIFKNPYVKSRLTFCSAITVIDCVNFIKQRRNYGYFFENQISYADMLVLSKITDIPEETLITILEELQSINPRVDILSDEWASTGKNDFIKLIKIQKYNAVLENSKPHITSRKNGNGHSYHKHGNHNFMTFGFVPHVKLAKTELIEKLSSFVNGDYGTLIRAKGQVPSENGMLRFNYVDGTYKIIQITQEMEPSVCFIGEELDKKSISELFEE
ncbi:MAG: CobW family GTP-binding protein [Ruminiclostridium sp.]